MIGQIGTDAQGRVLVELLGAEGEVIGHIVLAVVPAKPESKKRPFGFGHWSKLKAIVSK